MHEHDGPGDAGEEEDAHDGHQDGQEGPGQRGRSEDSIGSFLLQIHQSRDF